MNIKLHRSLNGQVINKGSTIKKIMNVLLMGQLKTVMCGGNLFRKKLMEKTKIKHKKLLTQTCVHKTYILRITSSDDHVINMKEKNPVTR